MFFFLTNKTVSIGCASQKRFDNIFKKFQFDIVYEMSATGKTPESNANDFLGV